MKKIFLVVPVLLLLCTFGASAQSFRSGYFLDDYVYGYRINPAHLNQKSFLGVAIGNIDLQNNGNIGAASFLFPNGNSIVTGLNKAVSADQFLGALKEQNTLSFDESLNIFSLGIAKEHSMFTVELNARALAGLSLPYDLFALAKKGGTGVTYDIGGLAAGLSAFGDLAVGYTQALGDMISIGGRVHILLGMADLYAASNPSPINLGESSISVKPSVGLDVSGLPTITPGAGNSLDFNALKIGFDGSPVGGFGAALDLGVEFKPFPGFEAMVAVNDLGFISWNNSFSGAVKGDFTFSGGKIALEGGEIKTDLDGLVDKLKNSFKLETSQAGKRTSGMPFNIAAGAKYKMPFYDKLSAGVLATYHNSAYTPWFDARLGVTVTPVSLIGISANIGTGTFGPTFGAALDAHLGPVNILFGLDSFMGKAGKYSGVPIPLNAFMANIHAGIAFTF